MPLVAEFFSTAMPTQQCVGIFFSSALISTTTHFTRSQDFQFYEVTSKKNEHIKIEVDLNFERYLETMKFSYETVFECGVTSR